MIGRRWTRLATLRSGPIFGAIGSWLPSFIHPFTFSRFTTGPTGLLARPAYRACAAWWTVNVAFEIAQHDRLSTALVDSLQRLLDHNPVTHAVANYVLSGSFDGADLVAASAGSLAAAALRACTRAIDMGAIPREDLQDTTELGIGSTRPLANCIRSALSMSSWPENEAGCLDASDSH